MCGVKQSFETNLPGSASPIPLYRGCSYSVSELTPLHLRHLKTVLKATENKPFESRVARCMRKISVFLAACIARVLKRGVKFQTESKVDGKSQPVYFKLESLNTIAAHRRSLQIIGEGVIIDHHHRSCL